MDIKNKRICFFLSSFRAGGGEKVMVELANAFAGRGYDTDLVVIKPIGEYRRCVSKAVNVVSVDGGRIILSLPRMIAYMRRRRPNVIIGLDEFTHLIALISKFVARTKTKIFLRVGNIYSILYERHRQEGRMVIPAISKLIYKYADHVIANSRGVADDLVKTVSLTKPPIVIGNPKPLKVIEQKSGQFVDHPWFINKTKPIIVGVGRLRAQKDYPTLIRAFARLVKELPAVLVIIGCGREEKIIKKTIIECGVENSVWLAGYHDNPYALVARSDVFVQPSLWEGLPNALLEAMAVGVAVVSSDCEAGPREILAPDTDIHKHLLPNIDSYYKAEYGVLFPVGDERALFGALKELVVNQQLRAEYSKKGRLRVSGFDTEIIVDKYEALF